MRSRVRLATDIAEAALSRRRSDGQLVLGLTGMEGSGARELGEAVSQVLSLQGETPVIVAVRDFMFPESEWASTDPDKEAQAYYSHAFALEMLVTSVLEPYRCGEVVDLSGEGPDGAWSIVADPGDILVLFGPFLMRSELRRLVDFLVYVEPSSAAAKRRLAERGEPIERVSRRYLPAEHMHAATHPPAEHADLVVDFADPAAPSVIWRR